MLHCIYTFFCVWLLIFSVSLCVLRSTLRLTKSEECTVSHWYPQFFAGWIMTLMMMFLLLPQYWGCLGLFLYFFLTVGLDVFLAYVLFFFNGSKLPSFSVLLSVTLVLPDSLGCTPIVTSNWPLWFVFTIWGFSYPLCLHFSIPHFIPESQKFSPHRVTVCCYYKQN